MMCCEIVSVKTITAHLFDLSTRSCLFNQFMTKNVNIHSIMVKVYLSQTKQLLLPQQGSRCEASGFSSPFSLDRPTTPQTPGTRGTRLQEEFEEAIKSMEECCVKGAVGGVVRGPATFKQKFIVDAC